ncbi:MAG TPA: DUF6209 family protein [Nitrospira sp.]|jgi:hypothetical protein|nr:hypothetical protein [Nitrospira sp.]MBP8199604.1 hypothetical protein [Nitrospira sp.]MDR4469671.1 DUF6209 family protein [Nitrospira sp.]HMS85105.1 DUF6209 family protein [Nitrospira sp.]
MATSIATVQFQKDWSHTQEGAIERGGRLKIDYDKGRLSRCFTRWRGAEFGDIIAYLRFHPCDELVRGSVVAPIHEGDNPPGMVIGHMPIPWEVPIPDDATQAEVWFHHFSQTSSRCDAWDSRFGANYWFAIGGAPPRVPAQPVSYRSDARTSPDMVNTLEQSATKINAFPQPAGGGSRQGTDLQTMLKVVAWVKETTYGANAWIDVHVFDGQDRLIQAQTVTLAYTGFGPAFRFKFSGKMYQGSTATPGSVQPKPDARKVQYRLYYEINFQVYTDGILHQFELQEDAVTR